MLSTVSCCGGVSHSAKFPVRQKLLKKKTSPLTASSPRGISAKSFYLSLRPPSCGWGLFLVAGCPRCAGCSLAGGRPSCSRSHVARQLAVRGGVRPDVITQQCKQRRARGSSFTPSTRLSCTSATRH